ncbi:MAG: DUF86 domain-containing protein [Candidatus Omnitrophica bacterium]|nr:DUF86 domain-containing protein [Candidatus Omnitrophota bacterium]
MTPKREFVDYLRDMLDAMQKVAEFTRGMDASAFRSDEKTAFAVIRALEVLGEAAKNIPQTVRDRYPQVPWREVAGIRDKLIHEYFGVNLDVVWRAVQQDLPQLTPVIVQMLGELGK